MQIEATELSENVECVSTVWTLDYPSHLLQEIRRGVGLSRVHSYGK